MSTNALSELKDSFRRPESIPFPATNPYSEEKFHLGKMLFFDARLSRAGDTACATCHRPQLAWGNGQARGIGFKQQILPRKVPTILNLAWSETLFWDGRAESLEEQALGPIQAPAEMNLTIPELIDRLKAVPQYVALFEKVFPGEPITGATIGRAIATFERTVVSDLAPFDLWIAGREKAISDQAKRGFLVFNGKGTCVKCHTGWALTNGSFADIGLPSADEGRGKVTKNKYLNHAFKAPTLRNIAHRAPYMHDGSLATLRDVIANYDVGGVAARETTRLFLKPLHLSESEKEDLLAFLETLSSEDETVTTVAIPRGERETRTWERAPASR